MNRTLQLLLLLFLAFGLVWYIAAEHTKQQIQHENTRNTVSDHENRLRLLEQDHQRRKNLRDKAGIVWQWCRKKIGF